MAFETDYINLERTEEFQEFIAQCKPVVTFDEQGNPTKRFNATPTPIAFFKQFDESVAVYAVLKGKSEDIYYPLGFLPENQKDLVLSSIEGNFLTFAQVHAVRTLPNQDISSVCISIGYTIPISKPRLVKSRLINGNFL